MPTTTNPLIRLAVRRALRSELGRTASREEVADAMAHVDDAAIDHAVAESGVVPPAASPGGFAAWLVAHKDQIAAVVKILLAALGA